MSVVRQILPGFLSLQMKPIVLLLMKSASQLVTGKPLGLSKFIILLTDLLKGVLNSDHHELVTRASSNKRMLRLSKQRQTSLRPLQVSTFRLVTNTERSEQINQKGSKVTFVRSRGIV